MRIRHIVLRVFSLPVRRMREGVKHSLRIFTRARSSDRRRRIVPELLGATTRIFRGQRKNRSERKSIADTVGRR